MKTTRITAFTLLTIATAFSLVATAQPAKRPGKPPIVTPAKKPPVKPEKDEDAGALAVKEERPTASTKDAATTGVLEAKQTDGGKSYRFEAVEVEGRLKSPQLVYFLRRVRAEFAAGDLGHRSFLREMDDTRNEPGL